MKTSLQRHWQRVATSIRFRGIAFTMLWSVMFALRMTPTQWFRSYRSKQLDRRYGLDTAGIIEPSALGLKTTDAELSHEYQPCAPETLIEVLSTLDHEFERFAFVDLGSGKGVALLAASMFPFKHIVGIEWSKDLASIARDNVTKFRHSHLQCRDITVLDGDATAYDFPNDPLVIFMFNPFKDELVRRVLDNINESFERCPRHIVVLYYNPTCKEVMEEAAFLHRVEWKNRCPIAVYETETADARPAEPRVESINRSVVLSR